MFKQYQNIKVLFQFEVKTLMRTIRFWIVASFLTVCLLAAYALSCMVNLKFAVYSPSLITSTPLYLLGNIDPIFFLLFHSASLLFLFDADHRVKNARIADLIYTRPVNSFEILASRTFASAGLLWAVAATGVFVMLGFGLVEQVMRLGYSGSLQLHSVFNLIIVDVPVSLIFWSAVVVFLSSTVQYRIVSVCIAFAIMLVWYFVVTSTPYTFLDMVSPSSNDTLFISDITPEFLSTSSLIVRLGTTFCSIALLGVSAWIYKRSDESPQTQLCWFGALSVLGIAILFFATTKSIQRSHDIATWQEADKAYLWDNQVDVESIRGTVHIDPKSRLAIDMSLDFVINDTKPISNLALVFNPGMKVSKVELNGVDANYGFKSGILQVENIKTLTPSLVHSIRVVASGRPNPRFAYLDSHMDYLTDRELPIQVAHAFGVDGSIFGKRYVALMPGVHWYPFFKKIQKGSEHRTEPDYFDLDLVVEIAKPTWLLVGPRVEREVDTKKNLFIVKTVRPIPEIALFASEFDRGHTEFSNTTVSVYFHRRHSDNLRMPLSIATELTKYVEDFLNAASRVGMFTPQDAISFVEVPNRLRTVGGGWRMDALNSLPGIVLFKERGFPVADISHDLQSISDPAHEFQRFKYFVRSGLGTDDFLSELPVQYWTYFTAASGQYATALDMIVITLLSNMPPFDRHHPFSVYSTIRLLPLTTIRASMSTDMLGLNARYNSLVLQSFAGLENAYTFRDAVWNRMEEILIPNQPSGHGHKSDLEVVLLKTTKIAEALIEYNNRDFDKIFRWLVAMRDKFAGRTYEYTDLLEEAKLNEILVEPFLTDWLTSSSLPGYVFSPAKTTRIAEDEQGNSRVQISFVVRNTEPVDGFVIPQLSQSNNKPVYLEAKSAKRVNLIMSNPPLHEGTYDLSIYTGMSLNRGRTNITVDFSDLSTVAHKQANTFEESSTWTPTRFGIVIDDLDEGFSFTQHEIPTTRSLSSSPVGWLRPLMPDIEHLIEGRDMETLYFPRRGRWIRKNESDAFGTYRRTLVFAKVSKWSDLATARFIAEIPHSDLWSLDFHVVQSYDGPVGDIVLRVRNNSISRDSQLDLSSASNGWNRIDQFRLFEGEVWVDVLETNGKSEIYADAIRWSRYKDDGSKN